MKNAKAIKYLLIIGSLYYFMGAVVHFFGLSIYPLYDGLLFSPYHDTVITLCAIVFGLVLAITATNVGKYRAFVSLVIVVGIIAILFSLYIIFFIDLSGTIKKQETIVEMILLIAYVGSLGYFRYRDGLN
jgi:hypothetical protein